MKSDSIYDVAAFCAAIDEGDASRDVVDFDEAAFILEMKQAWDKL